MIENRVRLEDRKRDRFGDIAKVAAVGAAGYGIHKYVKGAGGLKGAKDKLKGLYESGKKYVSGLTGKEGKAIEPVVSPTPVAPKGPSTPKEYRKVRVEQAKEAGRQKQIQGVQSSQKNLEDKAIKGQKAYDISKTRKRVEGLRQTARQKELSVQQRQRAKAKQSGVVIPEHLQFKRKEGKVRSGFSKLHGTTQSGKMFSELILIGEAILYEQ